MALATRKTANKRPNMSGEGSTATIDPDEAEQQTDEIEPERPRRAARPGLVKKTPTPPPDSEASKFLWDGKDDFWDWLSGFTSNDWNHLMGYLWRVSPLIDRKFAGKAMSIQKYGARFDLERIMLDHGSGGYRMDFTYTNPATKKQTRIAQHYFQIMNMAYPPKVPFGDWINDPENETWKWAEKDLKRAQNGGLDPVPGVDQNIVESIFRGVERIRGEQGDNASVTGQLIEMMKDNADQLRQATDPLQQYSLLSKLMKDLAPPADQNKEIFQFMRDELAATRQELKEFRLAQMAPQKDTITQLLDNLPKIKEAAETLGFKVNRGSAAGGTDWADVALKFGQQLFAVVPQFISYVQWNEARKEAQAHGKPAPPPPVQQTAPPGIPPPGQPSAATGQPDDSDNFTEEEKQAMMAAFAKYGQLLNDVGPILQDNFTAGLTGYDFRDWFLDRKGVQMWRDLRNDIPVKTLVNLSQLSPVMKEKLRPVERLEKFLEQFYTEPGQEPEGSVLKELDDDEEPADSIRKNTEPITK